MSRFIIGLVALAVIATVAVFGWDSGTRHLSAADGFGGPCNGQLTVTFNDGDHPDLWPKSSLEISVESGKFALTGPSPIISVAGSIDPEGNIEAFGEGTYAELPAFVTFHGTLTGNDPKQPDLLQGEYSVGAKGGLPGQVPINYGLDCPVKPPEKTYTITVLKQHADTKAGLPGWEMNLYGGAGCDGSLVDSKDTDANGIAEFGGLAAGSYSVEEKMQAGWNNITPLCQDTSIPGTGGAGVSGLPACPIQPDAPFPEPGCDEFNSAASVNVEFTNPPGARIHCDLGGPTQITRSAVSGSPDNIQTEITVLDLSGTCDPGPDSVTVRQSPDRRSTGKITEQSNDVPDVLEFKANSFFDVFFEVDVGGTILHNQEALHLECKIQQIPPYGCFYEPDVGSVTLYNADKKEVAKLTHAAHIPLDPKQKLLIFTNEPKPPTTPTPSEKKYGILVLKLDADTGEPISNWEINLYDGNCDDLLAQEIDNDFTNLDGYAEFTDLQPGKYSVEEKPEDGWNPVTPPCVDVELPGTAGASGNFIACPNPDATSCDSFDSGALVNVRLVGSDDLIPITLNGPTVIKRSALIPGPTDKIETEIIQLSLTGISPILGSLTVRLSEDSPSLGEIEEQDNDTGDLDFPADSFFDIFFEIDIGQGSLELHNEQPMRLECKIDEIPPELCAYEPPLPSPIPLLDDDGVVIAFIEHAMHLPLPPNQRLVVFHNLRKGDETPTPTPPPSDITPTQTPADDTPTPTAADDTPTPTDDVPPTLVPTDTPTPGGGDGDANKNDRTDSIDAALILQYIAGLTDPWPNSDVNDDQTTNAIDVALILQFVAGLLPSLPV